MDKSLSNDPEYKKKQKRLDVLRDKAKNEMRLPPHLQDEDNPKRAMKKFSVAKEDIDKTTLEARRKTEEKLGEKNIIYKHRKKRIKKLKSKGK